VACPFCIRCHIDVQLDTSISSTKTDINHFFSLLKYYDVELSDQKLLVADFWLSNLATKKIWSPNWVIEKKLITTKKTFNCIINNGLISTIDLTIETFWLLPQTISIIV
jgi:hypothetical protein